MAFHCDSDYFSFIKFFIMLNDVDMNNGPFTFVAYSHRGKRHVAGRMEDDEIVGPKDEVLYGTASAGDMVVCDTKGWHKAKPPVTGSRTVLQLVFASNLFGRTSK
jgi:ectoine hydroxylase-related dioxygenase (phytanoyl-CoA dioxygenase family)